MPLFNLNQEEEILIYYELPSMAYEHHCSVPIKDMFGQGRIYYIINEEDELWFVFLNKENKWEVIEYNWWKEDN